MMDIVIPLYDGFTALDAVGPYEVLSRVGGRVRFVAPEAGPVMAETKMLSLVAEASLDDVRACDVLVVPGGFGTRRLLDELVTTAPPKNREAEAAKRQARSAERYEAIRVYQQEKRAARAAS